MTDSSSIALVNSLEPREEECAVSGGLDGAELSPVDVAEGAGLREAVDRTLPLEDIRVEPWKDGVRDNLFSARGPSGGRGASRGIVSG